MATFNGEKFLRAQLDSLARQTRLPHELVVTDDGSSDRTVTIIAEFQKASPFPVRFSSNPSRLGYADNFLRAASQCSGELIAFSDQDDVWHPHKLARCSGEFVSSQVQLVAHATTEVDSDLNVLGYAPAVTRAFCIRRGAESRRLPWSVGCAVIVRREVIQELLRRWPPDHSEKAKRLGYTPLGHDNAAFFVANGMGEIRFIPDRLIQHRVHGANVTNSAPRIWDKLKYSAAVGRDAYQKQSRSMRTAAIALRRMSATKGDAQVAHVLERTAASLMRVAVAARVRARIYSEQDYMKRLLLIGKARGRGLYAPQLGKNGYRSVLKDLAASFIITR